MTRAPLRRGDFSDAEGYARAMYAHSPPSLEALPAFRGLAGEFGALLDAIWGDADAERAEVDLMRRAEAAARPGVLIEKLPHSSWPPPPNAKATLLTASAVGEALSAAEFAAVHGWWLDTSLTLSLELMGSLGDTTAEESLKRFLKCFAQYCRDNDLPRAYVAVVERSRQIGLHAHLAAHMPASQRNQFAAWVERWTREECKRRSVDYDRKAWALNRHRKENRHLHYALVHYALKGCDVGAIVQTAENAPDGRDIRLGDLLSFDFVDPGEIAFDRLYLGSSINARARGEWRSAWQRGERDVNYLYDAEFLSFVRRRYPVATLAASEIEPVRAAALALGEWYERAKPLGDDLSVDVQGWQTVAERNVEIAATALRHVCVQFDLTTSMVDPKDRARARAALSVCAEAAYRAVDEGGAENTNLTDDFDLPLGRLGMRRLAAAEASLRELRALLGQSVRRPKWALQTDLFSLDT